MSDLLELSSEFFAVVIAARRRITATLAVTVFTFVLPVTIACGVLLVLVSGASGDVSDTITRGVGILVAPLLVGGCVGAAIAATDPGVAERDALSSVAWRLHVLALFYLPPFVVLALFVDPLYFVERDWVNDVKLPFELGRRGAALAALLLTAARAGLAPVEIVRGTSLWGSLRFAARTAPGRAPLVLAATLVPLALCAGAVWSQVCGRTFQSARVVAGVRIRP